MTAHEWTDAELYKLEKRIKSEYAKAYKEIKAEIVKIMSQLQDDNGTMPLKKRLALLAKKRRLENLSAQLADQLVNAAKVAESLITDSLANVYMRNYNAFAPVLALSLVTHNDALTVIKRKVDPFDKLAFEAMQDGEVIRRRMQSDLTTSLLRGESIPKIAKRLQNAAEGQLANAVRVARTEVTRIEAAARDDIGAQGEELGFEMGKRWVATRDNRTRPSHRAVDHAEVRHGELFELEGRDGPDYMEYPGDVSHGAGPENVCNCRCTMIPFIIGIKITAGNDVSTADTDLLNNKLSVQ